MTQDHARPLTATTSVDAQRAEIDRQDRLRAGMRRRPALTTVVLLVLGAVFGAVATLTWPQQPTARTVTGVLGAIDDSGSAILLSEPAALAETGLGIVGVLWRDAAPAGEEADWQREVGPDGYPTCLAPGDEGRPVTLGLVTDPGATDRPPSQVVAWLECG